MRSTTAVLVGFLFLLLAGASAPAWSSQHNEFNTEQTEAIERIIRNYLLKNPEVVVEALENMREKQAQDDAERVRAVLQQKQDELVNDPGSPVGGNPKGDVTIVEFFDYRCPYCKRVAPSLARLMKEDGNIRFVYKEWPILGDMSVLAARAALAARKQGKYREFHDALMNARASLSEAVIFSLAEGIGLNVDQLKSDMDEGEIDVIFARNMALASSLSITGTPAFVIGDQLIPGAIGFEALKLRVRLARKEGPG